MPKASVIVPIYNAEGYIIDLLNDLAKQTFKSVEFLLVNDGSIDNSSKVISEYIRETKDRRFQLVDKQNGGVSSARNLGLDRAVGKYIIFVDSDDRLSPLFVEKYVKQIESTSSDIEVFSAIKVNDRKNLDEVGKIDYLPIASKRLLSVGEYIKYFSNLQAWGYPFCYIFKRKLWEKIRFDETIRYQEDVLAFFEVWTKNPQIKIHVNCEYYYYYVLRQNSALHTMSSKDAWQFVEVDNNILRYVESQPCLRESYNYLLALKASSLMITIATSCLENNDFYYKKSKKEFILLAWKAKYISKAISLRRKLQSLVVIFDFKFIIKRIYRYLYSD